MEQFNNYIKKNIYLFTAMLLLLVSLVFAVFAVSSFGFAGTAKSTQVATIHLGGYDEDQYSAVINSEITAWRNTAMFSVRFQGHIHQINLELFDFDLDKTLMQIIKNETNTAHFSLTQQQRETLQTDMVVQFGQEIMGLVDLEKFEESVLYDLQDLRKVVNYNLVDYINIDDSIVVLNQTRISNINRVDVNTISTSVPLIKIEEYSRFSILDELSNVGLSNEQMSIIASGVQSITAQTNFTGFTFEQYSTLPSWASSGVNVRILLVNQFDFAFFNNLDNYYTIEITKINDNELEFSLLGLPFVNDIVVETVQITQITYRNIYSENLNIGQNTQDVIVIETDYEYIYRLLISEGSLGQVIAFIRTTTAPNGDVITIRLYLEQILPINAIYEENVVLKEGE